MIYTFKIKKYHFDLYMRSWHATSIEYWYHYPNDMSSREAHFQLLVAVYWLTFSCVEIFSLSVWKVLYTDPQIHQTALAPPCYRSSVGPLACSPDGSLGHSKPCLVPILEHYSQLGSWGWRRSSPSRRSDSSPDTPVGCVAISTGCPSQVFTTKPLTSYIINVCDIYKLQECF